MHPRHQDGRPLHFIDPTHDPDPSLPAGSLCHGCHRWPVTPSHLRKVSTPQTLVLAQDVFYTHQTDKPVEQRYYAGLLAGSYQAELEDDQGTYFRGTGLSVVWADAPQARLQHVAQGGIWVAKGDAIPKYRMYRYLGSESTRPRSGVPGAQGTEQAANAGASAPANGTLPTSLGKVNGATSMQAGLGTGIAAGIIALTEGMDDGKIAFQRPDTPAGVFDGHFSAR
jgi:hypothetical protein